MTDALTAFGLTAADSGHFADVLAAASSNANTNVSMMGETFKYCAPVAGALGFSVEDAAKNMADTMQDNLEGQLTILKSQLQELAISFGDLLMPAVRSIVSGLQGMVDVLNAMPDGVKQVIMIIALLNTTYMCYLQYSVFDYPCVGLV